MKFLHTSDLHLGLRLCETRLNDDIAYILDEITDIALRENCSAVIIAGDIYDRTNPTPDSVAIFDRFVSSLAERGIAVMSIYGNHDSPERVAYMSSILEKNGVYFSPLFDGNLYSVTLSDEYGTAEFHLLPYLRPSVLRLTCPDFSGSCEEDALRFALGNVDFTCGRHVIIAHQFVGTSADASVGGSECVSPDVFAEADYTALGHLHAPHSAGLPAVRYSGSPIKTSFSEAGDRKSVTLVELSEKGNCKYSEIPLSPMRDLREMRGSYEEVTSPAWRSMGKTDDYLRIILTDEEDIPDVMAKLRTIYPNLMRIAYDNRRTRENRQIDGDITETTTEDALTPESVFAELYELQNNAPAGESMMEFVKKLFTEAREQ